MTNSASGPTVAKSRRWFYLRYLILANKMKKEHDHKHNILLVYIIFSSTDRICNLISLINSFSYWVREAVLLD